ncbi:MAG: hypothetical protein E6R03_01070 [Hyphomicrobiaceae bacterium]|nr:MAG: hypothetical protein E6R03_01070 [Hyphomicrobiaceae bacterium]
MIISRVWAQQPGTYFCLSTKSVDGKFRDHFFERDDFATLPAFLRKHQADNVYFCPHGFSEKRRQKEVAVIPRILWADLDHVDPDTIDIRPTIAIQSSPGRYAGLWFTDRKITEELNKRLSYTLGSDVSGWDLTQLLRVPGTFNMKYDAKPRVKTMWTDGPVWSVADLDNRLDPLNAADVLSETSDASAVYQKWEKHLPHWARKELIRTKRPSEGQRSEMLFKLANTMLEAGVPRDNGVLLLQASVWNKYEGRRDEERQLARAWDKATTKHLKNDSKKQREKDDGYKFLTRPLSEVEEREHNWIWYPYLARGEVTILQGDPEAGKSFISQNVAGHILTGKRLPCHIDNVPPVKGTVVYFDLENTADTVTIKRMKWNGYTGETLKNFYQEEHPFSIDDDEALEAVYQGLERIQPALIVFDTLNTYIGKADTNQGSQSQQSFIRFKEMAVRFNSAVLVLRHLTKGGRDKAMYRGQGSIAFTGVARVEITAGMHPTEENVRVLARSKGNLTRRPPALTYEIIDRGTAQERDKSKFEFGEFVDLTAEDIVSVDPRGQGRTDQREAAIELITTSLKDGAVEVSRLETMAEARSISKRTLTRAAEFVGIRRVFKGFGASKKTLWALKVNQPGDVEDQSRRPR